MGKKMCKRSKVKKSKKGSFHCKKCGLSAAKEKDVCKSQK